MSALTIPAEEGDIRRSGHHRCFVLEFRYIAKAGRAGWIARQASWIDTGW
ncbi:MAG: hypothetical protein AB7F79_13155 [Steroidobacteraceae bacterium]